MARAILSNVTRPAGDALDAHGAGDGPLVELRGLLARVGDPAAGDDTRLDELLTSGSEAVDSRPVAAAGDETEMTAADTALALDHDRIRAADPLGLDDTLTRLVAANQADDADTVRRWLAAAVEQAPSDLDREGAIAALRDAGMLLGSLRRMGIQPAEAVPGLATLLGSCGRTAQMVPRDTVVHYGLWNPPGERERHFVDSGVQEAALIDSVRLSCRLLPLAGAALDLAWQHDLTSMTGVGALELLRDALVAFAEVFSRTRAVVSPQFFAQQLRPFFDPVTVSGVSYDGPAAAFIPLYLVDELLWGGGAELAVMHREALVYARPLWRRAQARIADHAPVAVELERRAGTPAGAADPRLADALELTNTAVRALLRFRGQHVTTARRSYAYELTHYEHGSGGFAPDELKQVADEERVAATVLDASRRELRRGGPGSWAT